MVRSRFSGSWNEWAAMTTGSKSGSERIVIGLMSGTSLDGVDVACVRLQGTGLALRYELIDFACYPLPAELRMRIRACFQGTTAEVCRFNYDLGLFFADVVKTFLKEKQLRSAEIDLIGSHGQTVYHCHGHSTLSIGEAEVIARQTGIPVVYDFRAADIAVGGCGAPLVPYVDNILLADRKQAVALQNIGGMGNVTYLPSDPADPILAFDTGPGNAVLNEFVEIFTNGRCHYDRDGEFSQNGQFQPELLAAWLQHPYFSEKPPKSTGRERFGHGFARSVIDANPHISLPDLIRTAVSLTTHSIFRAYDDFLPPVHDVYISGGGLHHPLIMSELQQLFGANRIRPLSQVLSIPEDAKEAVAFAILAHEKLNGAATNVPSVTGAAQAVSLGKLALADVRRLRLYLA